MSTNHEEVEIKDPWCDPENPRVIPFEQISAAAYRIRDGVVRTPCDRSHLSEESGMEIYLKKEYMQYTGSFKERGARYTLTMLNPEQKRRGVISASAGNHALAMAYHGGLLGIPVTVVMPVIAPIMKIENCKRYGATIIIHGQNIGEAKTKALKIGQEKKLLYVNGFDHPNILAGQGTMALEILEQVPDVDAVVIPVGGGGLVAGCAMALKTMKPDVKIIGVEPELCPSFTMAMKHGKPVKTPTEASLADGLTVPTVGCNALATAAPHIDKMANVSEEWIAISILRLVEMEKAVVEGGGAAGVAAVLAGLLPELKGKKVVIPLCGGNIDTTILGRCLERGLAADGRLVKFTVTVSDRPGGISELAKFLCTAGVSIKDMMHERAWIKNDIFSVEVKVLAETRDYEHSLQLFKLLHEQYGTISIVGAMDHEEEVEFGSCEVIGDSGAWSKSKKNSVQYNSDEENGVGAIQRPFAEAILETREEKRHDNINGHDADTSSCTSSSSVIDDHDDVNENLHDNDVFERTAKQQVNTSDSGVSGSLSYQRKSQARPQQQQQQRTKQAPLTRSETPRIMVSEPEPEPSLPAYNQTTGDKTKKKRTHRRSK